MADVTDRTATLSPRATSGPRSQTCEDEGDLPVDDPERYEQVAEHARGGLGRVVRAVDKRLGRTVAVKELLHRDEWHEARFVREALITARLEHPGIVPVHEAGRWPNGDPYYVMKLVEGRTLKELIGERETLRERLGLLPHVIAIADAVGYAHSEGVIHRDLKPSNVVVGAFGETIVVDWGLARDNKGAVPEPPGEHVAAGSSASTISGRVAGTPAYMAPEQARGEACDERVDVYAIGAVLYELLAGEPPYFDVSTEHPDAPEAVISHVLAGAPKALVDAPTELVDLVGKAMARDPAKRYADASELAEDLRRYQTGKLVSAHAYTTWHRIRRKLAQHRGVALMALVSALALAAVGVMSFRRVVDERDIAETERARAEDARSSAEDRKHALVLVQAETSLRKDPTAAVAWLKLYPLADRDRSEVVDVVDEAVSLGVARHVLRPGDWVYDARFTPDGRSIVASVRDGTVRIYDVATGASRVLGRTASEPVVLALSPDGKTAVTAGSLGDVVAWSLAGGSSRTLLDRGRAPVHIRFDPAGTRVAIEYEAGPVNLVGLDGTHQQVGPDAAMLVAVASNNWTHGVGVVGPNEVVAIDTAQTGPPRVIAHTERAVKYVGVSPRGDLAIVHDGLTVWGVPFTGGPLHKLADYDGMIDAVEWSPDMRTLALAGTRPELLLVDIAGGQTRTLRGHSDAIYSIQFTADGKTIVTAGDDGTARLWNVASGTSLELAGHDDDVYRARFSPDEKLVVTASVDGSLRVWPVAHSDARVLTEGAEIAMLEVAGDHALVATPTSLARWDLANGTREPLFSWADAHSLGIGVPSPDGELLVVPESDPLGAMELRRRVGAPLELRGHTGRLSREEFSHDSKTLYSASFDGTLRAWDVTTGASKLIVDGGEPIRKMTVARDGRVAAEIGDQLVMIERDGTRTLIGDGAPSCTNFIRFDPVDDHLVVARCDNSIAVIDGGHTIELPSEGRQLQRIVTSPDGKLIAGALGDRTVRVWSASGALVTVLKGHGDLVMDLAFSPDSREIATASYDKTIRVWQLDTGRHRVLRGHDGAVDRVAWPKPDELVSGSRDGTLRIWKVPSLEPPTAAELARRLETATTARIDDHDRATTD